MEFNLAEIEILLAACTAEAGVAFERAEQCKQNNQPVMRSFQLNKARQLGRLIDKMKNHLAEENCC